MANSCQDIYAEAVRERGDHPLKSGKYKLFEAYGHLVAIRHCILNIQRRVASGQKIGSREDLGLCLGEDRATWLKDVPCKVARLLGHDVLPAIAALGADGVSQVDVVHLEKTAGATVKRLVDRCESVRMASAKIASVYADMKCGRSAHAALARDALDIVASINEIRNGLLR